MRKLIFICGWCLFLSLLSVEFVWAQGDGIRFIDNGSWDAVLKQAKKQQKLVFVDCYTSWCGPCKMLAKDVFTRKDVGDFCNSHFLCAKFDMEKGDGKLIYKKYKAVIPGFPTMLILSPEGELVHTVVGKQKPGELIDNLQKGLDGKTVFVLEKKYNAGDRDYSLIRDYCEALGLAHLEEQQEQVAMDYAATFPLDSLLSKRLWSLVSTHVTIPYTAEYMFVVKHVSSYSYRLGVDRYKLEAKLAFDMGTAVKQLMDIVKSKNIDTLGMARRDLDTLKTRLNVADVKEFPEYRAQLSIMEARLDGDVSRCMQLFKAAETFNILRSDIYFWLDCQDYFVEQIQDTSILKKILVELQYRQDHQLLKGTFTVSCYGPMVKIYTKLGDTAKATETEALHVKIVKELKERILSYGFGTEEELQAWGKLETAKIYQKRADAIARRNK